MVVNKDKIEQRLMKLEQTIRKLKHIANHTISDKILPVVDVACKKEGMER